jgi:hypothetical protein
MQPKLLATHIAICGVIGVLVSFVVPLHWLALAFWCSAVLYFTGTVAIVEDGSSGSPDESEANEPAMTRMEFLRSIVVCVLLFASGLAVQSWLGKSAG